jgi:hypothetical protein
MIATTSSVFEEIFPIRREGGLELDACVSFPRGVQADGSFDEQSLNSVQCDKFYEIPRTYKAPPFAPPQYSTFFGQVPSHSFPFCLFFACVAMLMTAPVGLLNLKHKVGSERPK